MRAFIAVIVGALLSWAPSRAHAAAEPPCLRLRATVACDLGDEVVDVVYEDDCEAPATSPDECCRWFGETARVRCAFTLGGEVLGTECRCLRFAPATSAWGIAVLGLSMLVAASVILQRRTPSAG